MTDIVVRLHAATLDKDNFPRMNSERWLPVGLAKEAITEVERLRTDNEHLRTTLGYLADNISDPALVAVAEAALVPRP